MPWLDHGIHAVAFHDGVAFDVVAVFPCTFPGLISQGMDAMIKSWHDEYGGGGGSWGG